MTIPHPDPDAIADFAENVLRVQLAPWQREGLVQSVVAYGFAVANSQAQAPQSPQRADQPHESRLQLPELRETYEEVKANTPDHAGAIANRSTRPSETPIGDQLDRPTVTTDLRASRNKP